MKRRRWGCVWLLAGALLACLACTEVPELLTLTDNPTNDFTIVFQNCDTSPATAIVLNGTVPRVISRADRSPAHRDRESAAATAAGPRKDLQALNSQWRL